MKTLRLIAAIMAAFAAAAAFGRPQWCTDTVLGDGYQVMTIDQPDDYSGPVRSTVVRRLTPSADGWGVLYVHGFNDYFFQRELGEQFNTHGYDFYAVDLRKYGRSLMEGQKPFEMRSVSEYFQDLDSAMAVMRDDGVRSIVMMGHSTGGLIVCCYVSMLDRDRPAQAADVKALVLNSPFLDWNLGKLECAVPLVSLLGAVAPSIKVKQHGSLYSQSLLKGWHGEWIYNTEWKKFNSSDVDMGWVRAIDRAQRSLRDGEARIGQPILLMYSARSVKDDEWTDEYTRADAVLDVDDMRRYGPELGQHVTRMRVEGGLHDLVLSSPGVRSAVYNAIFRWLLKIRLTTVE